MIRAYDRLYLDKARTVLGRMLDFAVWDLNYEIDEFFAMFLDSGVAERFGTGDCTVLTGKSGVEVAYEVLEKAGVQTERISPRCTADRSEEYWTGWALAYYQWHTALPFAEINEAVPVREVQALYSPFHEMDIRQFVDRMNEMYRCARPETNLKRIRCRAGFSQRQLAEYSGVPLSAIRQYEQRRRSINRTRADYAVMLAQTLCCQVTDLMEFEN